MRYSCNPNILSMFGHAWRCCATSGSKLEKTPCRTSLLRWVCSALDRSMDPTPSSNSKSCSDWNSSDLLAYNIAISPVRPDESPCYGADPSLDNLDPAILNSSPDSSDPNFSDVVADYLGYLNLATKATQESVIDNFATETLRLKLKSSSASR